MSRYRIFLLLVGLIVLTLENVFYLSLRVYVSVYLVLCQAVTQMEERLQQFITGNNQLVDMLEVESDGAELTLTKELSGEK